MRFISLRGEQGGSVERVPAQRQIKQGSHVKGGGGGNQHGTRAEYEKFCVWR